MRSILSIAAAALMISAVTSVASAQKKNTDAARASRAEAKQSLNDSFDRCVSLAKSRGFSRNDLEDNRASARNFVVKCMQGRQR
jgi:type II secretory pathway pseudopilin PulG